MNFSQLFLWTSLLAICSACGVKNAPRPHRSPEFKSWQDEVIKESILKEEFTEEELQDER